MRGAWVPFVAMVLRIAATYACHLRHPPRHSAVRHAIAAFITAMPPRNASPTPRPTRQPAPSKVQEAAYAQEGEGQRAEVWVKEKRQRGAGGAWR